MFGLLLKIISPILGSDDHPNESMVSALQDTLAQRKNSVAALPSNRVSPNVSSNNSTNSSNSRLPDLQVTIPSFTITPSQPTSPISPMSVASSQSHKSPILSPALLSPITETWDWEATTLTRNLDTNLINVLDQVTISLIHVEKSGKLPGSHVYFIIFTFRLPFSASSRSFAYPYAGLAFYCNLLSFTMDVKGYYSKVHPVADCNMYDTKPNSRLEITRGSLELGPELLSYFI
ncbi:hypothetical protein BKA69DRAFT_1126137 [Paraphysoderma sedebokerense]|nr:hypothetical protein BKA69DRAFT_1126137 [Paraphysoderma sedebokerense]